MCYIVCKTLTNAQRMTRVLNKYGVHASVKRLPSELRELNGCGYAVRVDKKLLPNALEILKDYNPTRVYVDGENGTFEELTL